MAPSVKRRKRLAGHQWLTSARSIDEICSRLVAGETLADIAHRFALKYMDVALWIEADEERRRRYHQAMELRKAWQRDKIVQELSAIAEADMVSGLFTAEGRVRNPRQMPPLLRRWIHVLKTREVEGDHPATLRDIRFSPKLQITELMMKHLGMLKTTVELDRGPTGPVRLIVEYAGQAEDKPAAES
jgi:hypothetical protein